MALSEGTQRSLDWALERATKDGITIWGFFMEGSELSTFSNFQDHSNETEAILNNTNGALAALLETVKNKNNIK